MAPLTKAVLDLSNRGQQEPVSVLDHPSARSQQLADEPRRPWLANELGFGKPRVTSHHHVDDVLLLGSAKEPTVAFEDFVRDLKRRGKL